MKKEKQKYNANACYEQHKITTIQIKVLWDAIAKCVKNKEKIVDFLIDTGKKVEMHQVNNKELREKLCKAISLIKRNMKTGYDRY